MSDLVPNTITATETTDNNSDIIFIEATGILEGTLLEDMVETVASCKKPYIRCSVPGIYSSKKEDIPLIYVPLWFLVLPLRKDDKVLIKFAQGSPRYPYLWRPVRDYELPPEVYETFELPENGEIVTFPETEPTVSAFIVNKDFYVISTDKYVFIRTENEMQILSPEGATFYTTLFQILTDAIRIEVKNAFEVKIKTMVFEASQSIEFKVGSSSFKLEPAKMTMTASVAESTGSVSPKPGGFLCSFPVDTYSGQVQTG